MPRDGRPPLLTPTLQEKIVSTLKVGAYRQDAAVHAGIGISTMRRWMARGTREHDSIYADLRRAVIEAEGHAKLMATAAITKAIHNGEWKAAAYWLERKFPHQFAEGSQMFALAKAIEQIETAAEAAGAPLPDDVWQRIWEQLSRDLGRRLPPLPGLDTTIDTDALREEVVDEPFSEDDVRVLAKLLRAGRSRSAAVDAVGQRLG